MRIEYALQRFTRRANAIRLLAVERGDEMRQRIADRVARRAEPLLVQPLRPRQQRAMRRILARMELQRRHLDEAIADFPGISLAARRNINLAIISYAELLCEQVDAFGLAARAKEAVARRVHEMSFGTRAVATACTIFAPSLAMPPCS